MGPRSSSSSALLFLNASEPATHPACPYASHAIAHPIGPCAARVFVPAFVLAAAAAAATTAAAAADKIPAESFALGLPPAPP